MTLRDAPLAVERLSVVFESDHRRVITRFFDPGGRGRIRHVLRRIARLSEADAARLLEQILERFGARHSDISAVFERHYEEVTTILGVPADADRVRRRLVGAYFTMEYSIESAALFNPSIVRHRDQSGLPEGAVRFIMSLRATGEGHISSIVFRTGIITAEHEIRMDPVGRFTEPIRVRPDTRYEKTIFRRKLDDIGVSADAVRLVLDRLPDPFTMSQLEEALAAARKEAPALLRSGDAGQGILHLARANYTLSLPTGADPSEVVIFPRSRTERRGIEDLRMVRFVDDDGAATFFGTYTAFDGNRILPQMIETADFLTIGVHTLNGARAQDKGMALFPRRIGGHYAMCSRIDGENLHIMYSDVVYFWESAERLRPPRRPWEFIKIGNCGSPIETPAGWLLLTHGVGPMRTYGIGAMLLDLDDPLKVIGSLDEPLLTPTEEERDGYVPNVVYTCGSMIHGGRLYIPFAASDTTARFASVPLDRLLDRLASKPARRPA